MSILRGILGVEIFMSTGRVQDASAMEKKIRV